jgi:hypothetical protein
MNTRKHLFAAAVALCALTGFAQIATVTISGRVTEQKTGAPVVGASVTFAPAAGVAVTDANGAYAMAVPVGWSGTATPSAGSPGTFAPQSRRYNKASADRANQNYIWTPTPALAIGGRVILADVGTPVQGVVITFPGLGTATTDANGLYSLGVPNGWSGTASASFAGGGTFSPATRRYTKVKNAKPNQQYVWHAPVLLNTSGSATWTGTNATAVLSLADLLTADSSGVQLLYPVAAPGDTASTLTASAAALQGVLGVDPSGVTLFVVHQSGGVATVQALVPGTSVSGTAVLQVVADQTTLTWNLQLHSP